MPRGAGFRGARAALVAALALTLAVAGCGYAGLGQPYEPEPVACAVPSLADLRAEHPDSLSEHEWQRIQTLEGECTGARAASSRDTHRARRDHHAWWMGSGIIMTVMMIGMWGSH